MSNRALTRPSAVPSVFEDFFKPWTQLFEDGSLPNRQLSLPAVNIKEANDQYTISLAAPGLQKDDFSIDIDGNMLTIRSEKEKKNEEKEEKFTRREYSYTAFSRCFRLPEDVKQENIDARYQNGELVIALPRRKNGLEPAAAKRIAVQ